MAESTIWWVMAGVFIAVEMLTGTFYLLMVSVGLVAGAIAAHAGLSSSLQIVVAAVVSGGAVVAWRGYRLKRPKAPSATANRDVNLDIGEVVQVDKWASDGSATVKYRGAKWTVAIADGSIPSAGPHRIVEVIGSRLMVKK
jgi:membrane protein implicated in regulation of membrane protease activity